MARPQVTKYVVDTEKAVKAVAKLSTEYNKNAQSLGFLVKEFASASNSGKNVLQSFTQINSSGQAVTTTISKTKKGLENYKVSVQQATESQVRFVAQQKAMNAALAQAQAGFQPIVLNRQNKDELAARFGVKGNALQAAIKKQNADDLAIRKGTASIGLLVNKTEQGVAIAGFAKAKERADQLKQSLIGVAESMERIKNIGIATVIYRGLSVILQGFKSATLDAAEFEKKIALIQTLSEGAGVSTQKWSNEIKALANELGTPIIDVATATYEGLSAQVVNTTDDFNILRASIKLAKLTESDVVTATNLVAAAINGFKKSTSEAENIASAFVETIDIGNVKLGELNSTLGRAGALAELTGSSFNEVLASVAVLTQSGIDSAESITLLNNVFVQLTKPSETLKAKLRELNFQTGEQAVSTLGLIGTLRALAGVAKDVPNSLAGLFPDIRGLRGAQGLISDAKKFDVALNRIENSSGRVNRQFAELQKSNGDKLFSELERIKTFFTTDVGEKFLGTVIATTEKFGGLANVVKTTTNGIIIAGAAFGAFKSISLANTITEAGALFLQFLNIRKALTSTGAIFQLFGPAGVNAITALKTAIGPAVAAFAAGYLIVDQIIKRNQDALSAADRASVESARKAANARAEAMVQANAKILQDFDKNLDAQRRKLGEFVAKETATMLEAARANQKTGKLIADGLDNSFDIALSVLRKNVSQTEALYEKANDAISKIRETQAKTDVERAEQFFDRNIKLAELERDRFIASTGNKKKAYQDYIKTLSSLTERRIAFTQERQVKAISTNDIALAEQLNSEIRSILDNLQNETIEVNGVNRPLFDQQVIQNRIVAEATRFSKLLADRIPQLEKEAAVQGRLAFQEKARAKGIEDLLNNTAKFSDSVVKNGVIDEKFAGGPQKAIEELKALQAEALKAIDVIGGLKNNQTLENLGLSKAEIQKQFAAQTANLQKEINLANQANSLRAVTDAQREYGEVARKSLSEINEKIVEQTKLLDANRLRILESVKGLRAGLNKVGAAAAAGGIGGGGQINSGVNQLDEVLKKLEGNDLQAATAKLNEFKNTLQQIGPLASGLTAADPLKPENTVAINQAVGSLESLLANMRNIQSDQLDKLQAVSKSFSTIDPTKIQTVEQTLISIYSASENFKGLGGLEASRLKLLEIIELLNRANELKNGIPTTKAGQPATIGVKGFANGGRVGGDGAFLADFFGGRFKRGTDIIPAMLSRGEFVVREPMAQKYASLLSAIQHDRAPIYRAEGTPTGSTSVGNIYVTLPAGSTPTQIRAFANAVRRGVKQGTINLGHRN